MGRTDEEHTRTGWRRLGVFWLSILSLSGFLAAVLEILGPPVPNHVVRQAVATPSPTLAKANAGTNAFGPGRGMPGPITDPDPALMEAAAPDAKDHLPRIGADGRTAMRTYAAGFDLGSHRPRAGVLLAGLGMNMTESDAAIHALPSTVSLAISPYADDVTKLLEAARATGHEYLVALPLEPAGYPLNDPGPRTLETSASLADNGNKLRWALSRFDGYAGATGVIAAMRGERLAQMPDQMDAVLTELAERGLFYVDPREGGGPVVKAWGRHIDMVIDDPPDRDSIDTKLKALEQFARDHGKALGLVTRPSPVAVARIAAWTNGLMDRGVALAPASALAETPAPVKMTERTQ